jgi:hypothetical protein
MYLLVLPERMFILRKDLTGWLVCQAGAQGGVANQGQRAPAGLQQGQHGASTLSNALTGQAALALRWLDRL